MLWWIKSLFIEFSSLQLVMSQMYQGSVQQSLPKFRSKIQTSLKSVRDEFPLNSSHFLRLNSRDWQRKGMGAQSLTCGTCTEEKKNGNYHSMAQRTNGSKDKKNKNAIPLHNILWRCPKTVCVTKYHTTLKISISYTIFWHHTNCMSNYLLLHNWLAYIQQTQPNMIDFHLKNMFLIGRFFAKINYFFVYQC